MQEQKHCWGRMMMKEIAVANKNSSSKSISQKIDDMDEHIIQIRNDVRELKDAISSQMKNKSSNN
jgi:hypothetical protein